MTHSTADETRQVAQWIAAIAEGNELALAQLFDFFRPRLERLLELRLSRKLAARIDVSDLLQDTFLDARGQVRHLVGQSPTQAYIWLRGLALERCFKAVRHHLGTQRRAVHAEVRLPEESCMHLASCLAASGPTPSQDARIRELGQQVQATVLRLKDEDREVILLRHFEGLTNQEVAQLLGLSASAAAMRYGRALSRLKQELTPLWNGGSHA